MYIKYYAIDGTEFEDKFKCQNYEENLEFKDTTCLNENFEYLHPRVADVDSIAVFQCKTQEAFDRLCQAMEMNDCYLDGLVHYQYNDIWMYSDYNSCWINLNEVLATLKEAEQKEAERDNKEQAKSQIEW